MSSHVYASRRDSTHATLTTSLIKHNSSFEVGKNKYELKTRHGLILGKHIMDKKCVDLVNSVVLDIFINIFEYNDHC